MNAKELRIGNFVKKIGGFTPYYINFFLGMDYVDLEVVGFEYTDDNHDCPIKDCEPIPLTEQWMLDFGFNKRRIYDSDFLHCDGLFEIESLGSFYLSGGFLIPKPYYFSDAFSEDLEIKHVHQLQNIVHALTGKDLIYTPSK